MHPVSLDTHPVSRARAATFAVFLLAALILMGSGGSAPAQDLAGKLSKKRDALSKVTNSAEDLQALIDSQNAQVDALLGQVGRLKQKVDEAKTELDAKQAKLDATTKSLNTQRDHLDRVRTHLRASLTELSNHLVDIYMAGDTDLASVIVDSGSFSDAVARSDYLKRIESYDNAIAGRVKSLRDQTQVEVGRLATLKSVQQDARDEIASKEADLADAESAASAQYAELQALQTDRAATLASLQSQEDKLGSQVSSIAAKIQAQSGPTTVPGGPPPPAPAAGQSAVIAPDGTAVPPADAPPAVVAAIEAANQISSLPYIWGGGHGSFDSPGYDCSGAISFALHGGGFLSSPLDSTGFESWGEPGYGNWITVYANSGHAFAVIAGLRWDTSGSAAGTGPRWYSDTAYHDTSEYIARHPSGY